MARYVVSNMLSNMTISDILFLKQILTLLY